MTPSITYAEKNAVHCEINNLICLEGKHLAEGDKKRSAALNVPVLPF